jgi:hypothetical protein
MRPEIIINRHPLVEVPLKFLHILVENLMESDLESMGLENSPFSGFQKSPALFPY